jgi:hypothetical protein
MLLQYQRSSRLFVITWVISASYQILSVYPRFVVALQCNATTGFRFRIGALWVGFGIRCWSER